MSETDFIILDPNGNPVRSQEFAPCPNCGRDAKARVPSASFGQAIYPVCPCGYEFKDLKCQKLIL